MKKIITTLLAIMAVVALAFTVAGCAAKVGGKTYVYEEIQVEIPSDATDLQVAAINLAKAALEKTFKDVKLVFNEDGTVNMTPGSISTWKQEGNTVTVTTVGKDSKFKISGKKLKMKPEDKNDYTVIFVLQ